VGMEVHCHSFIALALYVGKWSATCFTLERRAFGMLEYNTRSPNSWYVSCGLEETLLPLAGIESNKLGII